MLAKVTTPLPKRRSAARKSKRQTSRGLAAIETADVLRLIEERHSLQIIQKLRADLESLNRNLKPLKPASRPEVLRLLVILRRAVSALTDEFPSPNIQCLSASTSLLNCLIAQLQQLKHGIVGDIVRPTEGLGGSITKHDEYQIRVMAMVIIRSAREGSKTLKQAYQEASAIFEKHGLRYRNRKITPKLLRGWWYNSSTLKKSK
jgi:hypothetical protein